MATLQFAPLVVVLWLLPWAAANQEIYISATSSVSLGILNAMGPCIDFCDLIFDADVYTGCGNSITMEATATSIRFIGAAQNETVIDCAGGSFAPPFLISSGPAISFINMTVKNVVGAIANDAVFVKSFRGLSFSHFLLTKCRNNQATSGYVVYALIDGGTIENSTFVANTAAYGVIQYLGGVDVNVTWSKFRNNVANIGQGAFYVGGADSHLDHVTFEGNSCTGPSCEGGGLTISNGELYGVDCEFRDNFATYGGAFVMDLGATVVFERTFFHDNFVTTSGGSIGMIDSTLTLTDSWVEDSEATDDGGCIYVEGTFTATNTEFIGCFAESGGAIASRDASDTVTLTDCIFELNSASFGGALYSVGEVSLTSTVFASNLADSGGAVYVQNQGATVKNSTLSNCTFTNNTVTTVAAGLYVYGLVFFNVSNSLFHSNVHTNGDPPGVLSQYASAVYGAAGATLIVTTTNMTNNTGGSSVVYLDGVEANFTECFVERNIFLSPGGAICAVNYVSLHMVDSTVASNTASDEASPIGGIAIGQDSVATFTRVIITLNVGGSVGGLSVLNSNASITSSYIGLNECNLINQNNVRVAVSEDFSMTDSSVQGGGVVLTNTVFATLTRVEVFEQNSLVGQAGVDFTSSEAGSLTVTDCYFHEFQAGALFFSGTGGAALSVQNTDFEDIYTNWLGGAINVVSASSVLISDCTFVQVVSASSSAALNLQISGGTAVVTRCHGSHLSATQGTFVTCLYGECLVENSTLSASTVGSNGGALTCAQSATLSVVGVTVSDMEGVRGLAFSAIVECTALSITDTVVRDCTSTGSGVVLTSDTDGPIMLRYVDLIRNRAGVQSVLEFAWPSIANATLEEVFVSGNVGNGGGSAVTLSAGQLTVLDSVFGGSINMSAEVSGGNATALTLDGVEFRGLFGAQALYFEGELVTLTVGTMSFKCFDVAPFACGGAAQTLVTVFASTASVVECSSSWSDAGPCSSCVFNPDRDWCTAAQADAGADCSPENVCVAPTYTSSASSVLSSASSPSSSNLSIVSLPLSSSSFSSSSVSSEGNTSSLLDSTSPTDAFIDNSDESGDGDDNSLLLALIIVGSLVGGCCLCAAIGAAYYLRSKKRNDSESSKHEVDVTSLDSLHNNSSTALTAAPSPSLNQEHEGGRGGATAGGGGGGGVGGGGTHGKLDERPRDRAFTGPRGDSEVTAIIPNAQKGEVVGVGVPSANVLLSPNSPSSPRLRRSESAASASAGGMVGGPPPSPPAVVPRSRGASLSGARSSPDGREASHVTQGSGESSGYTTHVVGLRKNSGEPSGYTTHVVSQSASEASGNTVTFSTRQEGGRPRKSSVSGSSLGAPPPLSTFVDASAAASSGSAALYSHGGASNLLGGSKGSMAIRGMSVPVLLGQGGQASVYSAFSYALGYQVCLKVFNNSDAYERETSVLMSVPPHPNVIERIELDTLPPCTMAMKLALQGNLSDYTHSNRLTTAEVVTVATGLALGLTHLHTAGVCHLDIKPANVLLAPDNDGSFIPIITDFGASFVQGRADLRVEMCTVKYSAPEVLAMIGGKTVTEAGLASYTGLDVYCFGVTVWEIAVGMQPHEGKSQSEIVEAAMVSPLDFRVDVTLVVDATLRNIVDLCTREPKTRCQNFANILKKLSAMA